jgi:hypothetical protein
MPNFLTFSSKVCIAATARLGYMHVISPFLSVKQAYLLTVLHVHLLKLSEVVVGHH